MHDATPAYERETQAIIRDLSPLVGTQLSFGVVPDWRAQWPLAAHAHYCALIQQSSDEVLLHGYFHQRGRGTGPVTLLAGGSDEMNGLNADDTRRTIERGQRAFIEAFGARARGFLAPSWQRGRVEPHTSGTIGDIEYVMGFFTLTTHTGQSFPLATWTWDCGRWGWLGHIGDGIGSVLGRIGRRTPALAIHPRDLHRGFWPRILRRTQQLLDAGYEPTTPSRLLELSDVEVAV